jgi:nucleoside-diphosphate-sugar epimerase
MRVLIVGAAGSLGRQLAPELVDHGHEVVCFDLRRLEHSPYPWVLGDVREPHVVTEAAEGCQALVHIVAWHGIHLAHRTRRDFWRLNVDGAFNAFQAAQTVGARKVLYCSAMGVYGGIPRPPDRALRIIDESPVLPARDIYAYTKLIGEQLCALYHRAYGLDVVAFRLGMFVPVDFVHYGLRLVHGGVDERDLAQAFRLALENDDVHEGTFNLFAPTPFEQADEAALVADPQGVLRRYYADIEALKHAAGGRQLSAARWYTVHGDAVVPSPIRTYWKSERAQTILGWRPRYDFGRFLAELKAGTAEYVRDNRYPVPNAPAPWQP